MSVLKSKRDLEEPKERRTVTIGVPLVPCPVEEDEQEGELEEESSCSGMSYVCPQCQSTFGDSLHLYDHVNKHSQGLICSLCGYEGGSKEVVGVHERLHRNRSSVTCLLCKERLVEERQLVKHLSRHALALSSCPWCPFIGEGVTALKKHIDHHLAKFRVDCPFCNYYAFTKEDLRAHSDIHTGETRPAKTPSVRHKQTVFVPLNPEMTCQEQPVAEESEQKTKCRLQLDSLLERALFRCCLCGRRLKSDKQLEEHMGSHRKLGVAYCPYCSYQSTDREQVFQHVLDHLQPDDTERQATKQPDQNS